MKHNPLWKISVATTPEAEDAVAEMLEAILSQRASSWFNLETGVSTVTVFCEGQLPPGVRQKISAGLARIKSCGLKIGTGRIGISRMQREDWAESWKRHFHPIEIGEALLIKPSWSKRKPRKPSPRRFGAPRNQAVVVLDPGLSFGTGQHPTTEFCLRQIVAEAGGRIIGNKLKIPSPRPSPRLGGERERVRSAATDQAFLDIGTGSGILAIAAAKLGYTPVKAFDFDPEAVRVARANARINGVDHRVRITRGDVTKLPLRSTRRYDLVCANLVATLLVAERRRLVNRLRRGGMLALAGILKSEFSAVRKAFEAVGLRCVASRAEKEWRSGAFVFANQSAPKRGGD